MFAALILTMVQILYLLAYKPLEDPLVQYLDVMNEMFTLFLMYHVICLNEDFIPDVYGRQFPGNSFVTIVILDVALNFYFLFRTIWREKEKELLKKPSYKQYRITYFLCFWCSKTWSA